MHAMKVLAAFCAVVSIIDCGMTSEAVSLEDTIASVLKRSLPQGEGEGVDVRFNCSANKLEEHWKSLSVGCAEFLTSQIFNSADFPTTLRGLCQRCGKPLYHLVLDCVGDSRRLLRALDALCATNERGITCYEAIGGGEERFSDCERSPCSDACGRELRESHERDGCCLFSSVAALSDSKRAEGLWRRCDLTPPNLCSGAFTSSTTVADSNESTPSTSAAMKNGISSFAPFILLFLGLLLFS